MRLEQYEEHLRGQQLTSRHVDEQLTLIGDLVTYLVSQGWPQAPAGKVAVEAFARTLTAEGRNTEAGFTALREYSDWLGDRELFVALTELVDGHNALEVLAASIEERHGREVRDRVFSEGLPPLGISEAERCAFTRRVTERMGQQLSQAEAREAWFQVQHGLPNDVWRGGEEADRETYRQCGSIDEFLRLKRRERDDRLTRLRDEGRLWHTMEITDEVLEFITGDPEMEVGRREGDGIYITKVPYDPANYLSATDAKMKRYYACHCPMARPAILDDQPLSAEVCDCSLGHASHYLAGLGLELRGEVLESAIKGDTRCRFVFHLPRDPEQAASGVA